MKSYKQSGAIAQFHIKNEEDIPQMARLCDALGSETRLRILRRLQSEPYAISVTDLGRELDIPLTTLLYHLDKMEGAELIHIYYSSGPRGMQKTVVRDLHGADLRFHFSCRSESKKINVFKQTVGVGRFTEFLTNDVNFCTSEKQYAFMGDNCYHPDRFDAQLVYTTAGIIAYKFSNHVAKFHRSTELTLSLEICSEAPYFDNDRLSDITFWINGKELYTWTSPGDFGDHRGLQNPEWWRSVDTQHGVMITLSVDANGVTFNGSPVRSKVNIDSLRLGEGNCIELRFGNKPTSTNQGGFNVFGKRFGDYPQDIELVLAYEDD